MVFCRKYLAYKTIQLCLHSAVNVSVDDLIKRDQFMNKIVTPPPIISHTIDLFITAARIFGWERSNHRETPI